VLFGPSPDPTTKQDGTKGGNRSTFGVESSFSSLPSPPLPLILLVVVVVLVLGRFLGNKRGALLVPRKTADNDDDDEDEEDEEDEEEGTERGCRLDGRPAS
jgi:hypothetical protein